VEAATVVILKAQGGSMIQKLTPYSSLFRAALRSIKAYSDGLFQSQ
jgi:hypothetical protein